MRGYLEPVVETLISLGLLVVYLIATQVNP